LQAHYDAQRPGFLPCWSSLIGEYGMLLRNDSEGGNMGHILSYLLLGTTARLANTQM